MKLWLVVGLFGVILMAIGLQVSPFICARPDVPCPSPSWAELVFDLGAGVLAAAVLIPVVVAIRSARRADKSSPFSRDIRRR